MMLNGQDVGILSSRKHCGMKTRRRVWREMFLRPVRTHHEHRQLRFPDVNNVNGEVGTFTRSLLPTLPAAALVVRLAVSGSSRSSSNSQLLPRGNSGAKLGMRQRVCC